MDPLDRVRNVLGNGSDPDPDPEERLSETDGGQQVVVEGGEQIAIELPEDADVDRDRIEAALSGRGSSVNVRGQAGGDTTVTPVASGSDIHITDSAFDLSDWEYKAHLDDRITSLMENRIDYNQTTGQWILANDDLIPGILIRLKSLMMGQDGLDVKPKDPDSDADQRLADHLEKVYRGDQEVEAHVDPEKVVDRVLEQNVMNAVAVMRSTDLQHLNIEDLSYVKDGETGEEIYVQESTSYTTFEIEEDGDVSVELETTDDEQALEIGQEVLDVRLYRTPPLQAVADDVVNKMQLKHLQGRKAELASIGGVIIKVNPPAWLDEADYDSYVSESDSEFGDQEGRLLELVMAQQIDDALDTLEDYQTATVMSIPENWETDTIELPEMDEPMSDMIRDANQAISRRLLLPLDLQELESGSELSRNTMMSMFVNQLSGWQGQITDLFDQFAKIQAEIHGISGSVEHSLPRIEAQDEKQILKLFQYSGLLGITESEGRELANELEGVDLETDPGTDMPQPGGPQNPEEREQQMQEMLQQQNQQDQESPESGQNQGPEGGSSGPEPQGAAADNSITRRDLLHTIEAAAFEEGTKVEVDGTRGVITEVRTATFTGPDGEEHDATEEDPVYVVATMDGAVAVTEDQIQESDWGTDQEDPASDLKSAAEASAGKIEAATFDYPDSWEEAEAPARLILLDAWASMTGQFNCSSHDCCHGTMVQSGMSDDAADEFCASMKDKVLGGWEGWRKGAAAQAQVTARHGFSGFETLREAASHVRQIIEKQIPEGQTAEMRKRADLDDPAFAIIVRDRQGNIQGSMLVREAETDEDRWVVIGGQNYIMAASVGGL